MIMTERDYEIVRFILNMKFASVTDIHQKFFKIRKDGGISNSEWYTRERLRELQQEGYILSVRYRFENKAYYIGTRSGYQLINMFFPEQLISKPIDRIDIRTFDHDVKVMQSRLILEQHEKVTDWQSDRQLKSILGESFFKNTNRDATPDGVYKSLGGRIIAFEYEISQKSKQRYYEKIKRYVQCIRRGTIEIHPQYDHVRIVCAKEHVQKILTESTVIYKNYFTIESADEFFERYKTAPACAGFNQVLIQ